MIMDIDGIPVNYAEQGAGDAVLLLHGWGADITLFGEMINTLSVKYRVLAPDMPGFGKTPEPPRSWNVDDYVDFVLKFIEKFGLSRISLLGHSFGGRVIIKMNARKERSFDIEKIVFVDAAGIKPEKTWKQKMNQRTYKMGKAFLSLPPVKGLFPDALDNLRKKRGSADYNSATPIMRETLVKVVNEDLRHLLPEIACPALLIWGEQDTATPLSDAKLMEQLIPDAGLVVVQGAGHYSFLEHPYYVMRVLKSFFGIEES